MEELHFISGLPRSGSTLLAAILRQNPRFHAAMSSPLATMFTALLGEMSGRNEFALYISEEQKSAVLKGLFANFYGEEFAHKVVFDTNRLWCCKLPALARLFPKSKIIACVRHVPMIFDSFERLIRKNTFEMSKMFNFDPAGTVYGRVDALYGPGGILSFALNALKEAYYGEEAKERLLLLTYETLARDPKHALAAVYDFIGEKPFAHDFDHVEYSAAEFDARIGTPGLHNVDAKVRYRERASVLPPDIVFRFKSESFWINPELNHRGVRVI